MKKRIRLTESNLHRIVKESVNRVLREDFKHNKEAKRLYQQSVFPSDMKRADEYRDIPLKINDGLNWLSWLLPNDMEVKRIGILPRVSKEISNAVQILDSNRDIVIDAVMNTYSQFIDKQGYLSASHLDKDITNGVSLQDRYDDYFGDEVENDWDRARDNDYEY